VTSFHWPGLRSCKPSTSDARIRRCNGSISAEQTPVLLLQNLSHWQPLTQSVRESLPRRWWDHGGPISSLTAIRCTNEEPPMYLPTIREGRALVPVHSPHKPEPISLSRLRITLIRLITVMSTAWPSFQNANKGPSWLQGVGMKLSR